MTLRFLKKFYAEDKSNDYDQTWNRKKATAQLVNQIDSQIDLAKAYFDEVNRPTSSCGAPAWEEKLKRGEINYSDLPKDHPSYLEPIKEPKPHPTLELNLQ